LWELVSAGFNITLGADGEVRSEHLFQPNIHMVATHCSVVDVHVLRASWGLMAMLVTS